MIFKDKFEKKIADQNESAGKWFVELFLYELNYNNV